jgi:hypothetical protein
MLLISQDLVSEKNLAYTSKSPLVSGLIWLLASVLVYYTVDFNSSMDDLLNVAISIFIITILAFAYNSKHTIAIRELIAFIYSGQLLIGPVLSYIYLKYDYYAQPVNLETYFGFAIPALVLFILGLFTPLFTFSGPVFTLNKLYESLHDKLKIAYILLALGFASGYILPFVPGGLAFFVYLLANAKYVGAIYLYFTKSHSKYIVLSFIIITLVLDAVATTMFHNLFLWITFIVLYVAYIKKYSLWLKLSTLGIGFIVLFATQAVKGEYRNTLWYGGQQVESNTNYFTSLIQNQIDSDDGLFSERNIRRFIYRINQGWIVAHTMNYTPNVEPFADGETISQGFSSSILPRFLNPDKYVAGGREYFERFSGLVLVGGTSMNLSPLGEAYANFGVLGGAIFMFFFGLIINIAFGIVLKISQTRHTIILWLPLIFLQVVKAETDFTTVFNHLVKASFVVWLLYWGFEKYFRIKL